MYVFMNKINDDDGDDDDDDKRILYYDTATRLTSGLQKSHTSNPHIKNSYSYS